MSDLGLTHVALPVIDIEASIDFYRRFARMEVVHRRTDEGTTVVWLSDRTRPFVIVLLQVERIEHRLAGLAHLGIGLSSREEVDRLCIEARAEKRECIGPIDAGEPVGYYAFIADPDGHNLEISYGQEVGLAVLERSARKGI